jgi:hypothetical protein
MPRTGREDDSRKHRDTYEYRLSITPQFNLREQKYKTLVLLETTTFFSSFRYELLVKETMDRNSNTITYAIHGLKTPQLSLPAAGHAQFVREYEDLHGTYTIVVRGLDGTANSFSVRISPKKVWILQSPTKRFVDMAVGAMREVRN